MGKIHTQLRNENTLRQNAYTFQILKLPDLAFACQKANVPGVSSPPVLQSTPINPLHWDGSEITYDDLQVTFLVDENLENWIAIHDWIRTSAGSINSGEYVRSMSDAILTINTNKQNPNLRIVFKNCLPVQLSALDFDFTRTDSEALQASVTFKFDSYSIET